jgi:branched-chain amino acid transport system ATP-binding protein
MAETQPLLVVRDLFARYDGADVLHGVTIDVSAGEFVAVIGANTAGKSTLLRCISRLVPHARGTIRFAGEDLMALPAHRIPERGIAHVPEGRHVFPALSVEENVLLGGFTARRSRALEERLEKIYALFPRLAERRKQAAGTLSGGEQQMVAVGRALMLQPRLLILDEPSHGLAPIVVDELHRKLGEIHRTGVAILLVEQNTAMALSMAQRAYVLQSGRVALSGSARALAADDRVRAAYLGI